MLNELLRWQEMKESTEVKKQSERRNPGEWFSLKESIQP